MRKNKVKEKISRGEPALGIGLLWGCPDLEFCGYLGFDWIWLDGEHGRFSPYSLWDIARASEVGDIIPIIRAPQNDSKLLLEYLEAGIMGVIIPQVRTKEDVVKAVNAAKYPPLGKRGSGAIRPAKYGLFSDQKDYFKKANEETMVIALVEDPVGIENLAEILLVEGLDAVVIGYSDLSMSMGHPGEPEHPDVRKVGKKAREMIVTSDKWLQETIQDPNNARKAVETGANLVRCSLTSLLRTGAQEYLEKARGYNYSARAKTPIKYTTGRACSFYFPLWKTTFPSMIVVKILILWISSGLHVRMSLSSIAKSANFPDSIEPLMFSSWVM